MFAGNVTVEQVINDLNIQGRNSRLPRISSTVNVICKSAEDIDKNTVCHIEADGYIHAGYKISPFCTYMADDRIKDLSWIEPRNSQSSYRGYSDIERRPIYIKNQDNRILLGAVHMSGLGGNGTDFAFMYLNLVIYEFTKSGLEIIFSDIIKDSKINIDAARLRYVNTIQLENVDPSVTEFITFFSSSGINVHLGSFSCKITVNKGIKTPDVICVNKGSHRSTYSDTNPYLWNYIVNTPDDYWARNIYGRFEGVYENFVMTTGYSGLIFNMLYYQLAEQAEWGYVKYVGFWNFYKNNLTSAAACTAMGIVDTGTAASATSVDRNKAPGPAFGVETACPYDDSFGYVICNINNVATIVKVANNGAASNNFAVIPANDWDRVSINMYYMRGLQGYYVIFYSVASAESIYGYNVMMKLVKCNGSTSYTLGEPVKICYGKIPYLSTRYRSSLNNNTLYIIVEKYYEPVSGKPDLGKIVKTLIRISLKADKLEVTGEIPLCDIMGRALDVLGMWNCISENNNSIALLVKTNPDNVFQAIRFNDSVFAEGFSLNINGFTQEQVYENKLANIQLLFSNDSIISKGLGITADKYYAVGNNGKIEEDKNSINRVGYAFADNELIITKQNEVNIY